MTEGAARPDPALQLLGATLRRSRNQRALSQRALADRTGILHSYIGQIERGLRNITVLTLLRLAQALDIPTTRLLAPLDLHAGPPSGVDQTPSLPPDDPAILLHRLGVTIRAYRQQRALSQMALATKTGLGQSYLSAIELGQRNLSVLSLVHIAEALDLPVSQLLTALDAS